MIRQTAVAGQFYPADSSKLSSLLDSLLVQVQEEDVVKAIIVPHAGYIYSGEVAGEVFGQIEIPHRVIMVGPNHQGLGADIAVSGAGAWSTPLGDILVDEDLRRKFLELVPQAQIDDDAHRLEHSLEVMLPFLYRKQPELYILPVALRHLSLESCLALGNALADLLKTDKDPILLLASSDMNHFLPAAENEKLDKKAISEMTRFDPEGLFQTVMREHISMCGVLPAVVVMQAVRSLGGKDCRLVRYAHSGQVSGDNSRVVGYAGLTIR